MRMFTHAWRGLSIMVVLSTPVQAGEAVTPPVGAETMVTPAWGCPADSVPVLDPTSPQFLAGDLGAYTSSSQPVVDCFAWQTFAALQWPVDSGWPDDPDMAGEPDRQFQAADWGIPVDPLGSESRPRVWETFKPVQDIFLANGAKPTAWGVSAPGPGTCGNVASAGMGRQLNSLSKVPSGGIQARLAASVVNPDETNEAMGGWLTDQAGELVWFERLVSRAEFEYIVDNQLYLASRQQAVATNQDGKHPHGLSLPTGQSPQGAVQPWQDRGAMEIKVAWRNLSDYQELWPRYHTVKAWLTNPRTGDCQQAVMGMVGFHFILKSEHFPNFIWATFEHIDNVPTPSAGYTHPNGFSFYDPQCASATPKRDCAPNQPRVKCDTAGNCKPLYPMSEPVQVERRYPIPRETTQLNLAMQDKIAEVTEGKSVFQYYQLINTQWAQSPVGPYTAPGKTVPLKVSSMTSGGNQPVANVTMETYVQDKACTDCHKSATIATSSDLASDFSFIFFQAESGPEPGSE